MKKILTISAMLALLSTMYAEAPEMQKYLPTEWKYMNKYDGPLKHQLAEGIEKEKKRLEFSEKCFYTVMNKYGGTEGLYTYYYLRSKEIDLSDKKIFPKPGEYIYYEEELLGCTFYYMIERESDDCPMNMFLAYKKGEEFIFYNPVCYNPSGEKYEEYRTYLIPGKKHRIKAVCRAYNYIKNGKGLYTGVYYQLLEKQTLGKELTMSILFKEVGFYSSSFLYDRNNPMRYGLFNAFDGDPSTSFVEDERDDLLHIQVSSEGYPAFPNGFSEFKIINGYAQNEDLYEKNNRVKLIKNGIMVRTRESDDLYKETEDICLLDDNTLGWQKFKFHIDQYFLVKDIYKGTKYSDTCIAELDFKYDGGSISMYDRENREWYDKEIASIGWLFSSEAEDE